MMKTFHFDKAVGLEVIEIAKEKLTKELESIDAQLCRAIDELNRHDDTKHSQASLLKKQMKVETLESRRKDAAEKFETARLMQEAIS